MFDVFCKDFSKINKIIHRTIILHETLFCINEYDELDHDFEAVYNLIYYIWLCSISHWQFQVC